MWELDYKESWVPKNWCFWTVVLEKTLESPLECKEIRPVNPKGNQSWIFIGRTDAEGEALLLWPPIRRSDSVEKTLMLGKIEGGRRRVWQRMRWLMDWWHHRVDEHNFEQDPGVGDGLLQSMGLQSQTWLSDWTEPNLNIVQRGFTFLKAKLNM